MKTRNHTLRMTAVAAAVTLLVGGVSTLTGFTSSEIGAVSLISSAYAEQGGSGAGGGSGGHKGVMGEKGGGGQGGQGIAGQGQRGGKSMADVLAEDEDDTSDRPDWAGVPGRDSKPGGGNAGGSTNKGGDYGDLFVVLRDASGEPVTTADGEFYILLSDGTVVKTVDGEVPADYLALALPVEFGRMNIARSPDTVLEHSLDEALSKLDGTVISTLDELAAATDASGRLLTTDGLTIDSPLENLALYEALLTAPVVDGYVVLSDTVKVLDDFRLDLAAAALAASSDKTGSLTADEIMLISGFMDVDDELAALVGSYSYDRDSAYANETVSILVDPEGDGTYVTVTGSVLDLIDTYGGDVWTTVQQPLVQDYEDGAAVQVATDLSGIYLFTQAADDAVQVIEFVHDGVIGSDVESASSVAEPTSSRLEK